MPKLRREDTERVIQAESDMDWKTFVLHLKFCHGITKWNVSSSDRITHTWEHEWPLDHVHASPVKVEGDEEPWEAIP